MQHSDGVTSRSFCGENGATEHYISLEAAPGLSFAEQLRLIEERYAGVIEGMYAGVN